MNLWPLAGLVLFAVSVWIVISGVSMMFETLTQVIGAL
jgi:hypothetical protein